MPTISTDMPPLAPRPVRVRRSSTFQQISGQALTCLALIFIAGIVAKLWGG